MVLSSNFPPNVAFYPSPLSLFGQRLTAVIRIIFSVFESLQLRKIVVFAIIPSRKIASCKIDLFCDSFAL
jgi:hypothetical protein